MVKTLENHELETMLEDFMRENPMGDSRDLAKYFYERGYADATKGDDEDARLVYVAWDVSDSEFETFQDVGIPRKVWVPMSVEDDDIADWLSDEYGYCVESFIIEGEE